MEFLVPWFAAAGALAAGVPLVLHLLRRTPAKQMPFSLVRFLKPTQPTLTRRSSIEHWPLLLLRILALVLIGLAFARPFFRSVTQGVQLEASERYVTLLIDRSASMKRAGIRESVIKEIQAVTDQLESTDLLSVVLYSNEVETVLDRASWAAYSSGEKSQTIEKLQQTYKADWHCTNTGVALQQSADDLLQAAGQDVTRQIILVTDFQEGSDFASLQAGSWPAAVQVQLRQVDAQQPGNASLHTMTDRRTGQSLVRISNGPDATASEFALQPVDQHGLAAGDAIAVVVPPGRQSSRAIAELTEASAVAGVILQQDVHDFDNSLSLPESQVRLTRIAHVGSTDINDEETMRYYLQRALNGTIGQSTTDQLEIIDCVTADGIVLPVPEDIELVMLTDTVPADLLSSLQQVLDRGGMLIAALHSVEMSESITDLLPQETTVTEAVVDDYAMLGRIDFEHSLFNAFSESRFADFSSIRFWKHRAIRFATNETATEPVPWNVVARFDSGLPAVVRFRQSKGGRLYVLASGWHPNDSQWALSSRFPPMLSRFVDLARPEVGVHRQVIVGEAIRPSTLIGSDTWSIRYPDGSVSSSSEITDDRLSITEPGHFLLQGAPGDVASAVSLLAEVDPNESRTAPLPDGQLYSLGLAGQDTEPTNAESDVPALNSQQLTSEQIESQQKYWRWFLLAGLACLVLETVLAAVIHRRQPEAA